MVSFRGGRVQFRHPPLSHLHHHNACDLHMVHDWRIFWMVVFLHHRKFPIKCKACFSIRNINPILIHNSSPGIVQRSLSCYRVNKPSEKLFPTSIGGSTNTCKSSFTLLVEMTPCSSFWYHHQNSPFHKFDLVLKKFTYVLFYPYINYLQVIISLYIISVIGSYFDFVNLLFIGMIYHLMCYY